MTTAAEVDAFLEDRRHQIERALDKALPDADDWPPTIHRAVRYSLFAPGKRIRPLLALAAGEAVGATTDEILPYACAVEMIHTYSLIHDDLPAMDNDDLRRGRPTSHKVFGEAIAILAGDALLTRAFHMLAEIPADWSFARVTRRVHALAVLGEAAGTTGLIGGQVEDLESEGRAISAEALERLHRAKTGALLSACVRGAAAIGGADEEITTRLGRYASAVGLAFQVVDDVLDATQNAEQLGKTAGKDSMAEKATYVRIHGLSRAQVMAQELLAEALEALEPLGANGGVLATLARLIVERKA
jgi:geranylgeranyl diphosphate synthase type II